MAGKRQVFARRKAVEKLLIEKPGIRPIEIAAELGVKAPTVARDIRIIKKEWAERRADLIQQQLTETLRRYDEMIEELWPAAQRGNTIAWGFIIKIEEERAKLLGMDKIRVEHDISGKFLDYLEEAYREQGGE